jgi:hypothetical protein
MSTIAYSDRLTINIKNMIDALIDEYKANCLDWCIYGCDRNIQCDVKVDNAIRIVDRIRLGGKNLIQLIKNILEDSTPGRISKSCVYCCTAPELDYKKIEVILNMLKKLENMSR